MSEGDSPHGACDASENDPNSSIINKVRSRVSSILPNSLSKWFSPSTSRNDSKNGSLRRRRNSSSDEEGTSSEENQNEEQSSFSAAPPMKKSKSILLENTSTPNLTENISLPGSSGLNSSLVYTQTSNNNSNISISQRRLSTTPTSIILNRRKYLGQNKTSSPYDFQTKNPNLTKNFETLTKSELEEENIIEEEEDNDNSFDRNNREVKGRRGIRDNSSLENLNLDISKRRKLNLDTSTLKSYSRRSLNISLTSAKNSNNLSNLRRSSLNSYRPLGVQETFADPPSEILEDVEEEENNEEEEINEINIPIEDLEDQNLGNGIINETPSDSDGSISCCSAVGRPASSTSITQRGEEESGRYSGLFGNDRKNLRPTNTGINFSVHLQTEKSLFSDKNMAGGLNKSTMSLNSWTRRPSFNASLYGSTSALSDSRIINTKSPFYDGKTMYGGASTYSRNHNRVQKALRAPVQIRPSSSLSTLSSSNTSLATDTAALSNTAKRILDLMNQFTSPLADAKKMGNVNVNSRIPPLVAHRQRFTTSENDLQLNRSIRLSNVKLPYNRPGGNNRQINKLPACTNELQIPSVTQLLQMKKLQNNTEQVRQLAANSKSILNTKAEYKLPNQDETDDNGGNKHINKIRNKISKNRSRPEKMIDNNDDDNLQLPSIPLPLMKSVPKIDIAISSDTTKPTAITRQQSINSTKSINLLKQNVQQDSTFKFSKPINLYTTQEKNIESSDNFKFSEPLTVNNNCNKSAEEIVKSAAFVGFKFASTSTSTPSAITAAIPKQTMIEEKIPTLKTGSVLDALKGFSKSETIISTPIVEEKKVETSKINNPLPSLSNSFGDKFKVKSDQWECDTCMIRNKSDAIKCVACETPKPGSAPVPAQKSLITSSSLLMPTTTNKINDDGFKMLIAKQNEKWECSACMTRNESTRNKCVCCEQTKPGAVPENVPKFSFGLAATTSKFNFGIQPAAADVLSSTTTATTNTVASTSFTFGNVSTSSTITTTVNPVTTGGFKFGVTAASDVKPASIPTITFGSVASASATNKDISVTPASGFTFGVKPTDLTDQPTKGGFAFGDLTSKTMFGTVVEQSSPAKKITDSKDEKDKIGFSFGNVKKQEETTSGPNPNKNLTDTTATTTDTKTNILKPSGNFLFGSQMLNKSVLGSNTEKEDKNISKPMIGAFGFGIPTTTNVEAETNKLKPTNLFGGVVDKEKDKSLFTKPTSSNIPPKPATTAGLISFMAFKPPTDTLSPSFGTNSLIVSSATSAAVTATTTITPAASTFGVGAVSSTNKETKTPFSFGTPNTNKEENKGFGSTFSVTKTENQTLFEGFSSTPSKQTTSTFAAPTQTASSSFNFTSSTSSVVPSTTTNTESTFAFGGAGSSNTTLPAFGMGLNQTQPTFGQTNTLTGFGSFSSTQQQQQQTPTTAPPRYESTFGQRNNSPKFGVQNQQTGSTGFNTIANAASPSFGSSASIFGTTQPQQQQQQQTQSGFGTVTGGTGGGTASTVHLFGPPQFDTQNTSNEPAAKKSTGSFGFGGAQQGTPTFAFGGNNNTNNNNNNNNPPNKQPFNFSATATPSFNFGSSTNQPNAAPFAFGADPQQAPVQSFGFSGAPETTPNAPYQFGATSNNPFASQTTAVQNTQPQLRRKVRAMRRLTNQR